MKHSSFGVFAILLLIVAVVVAAITGTSAWRAPVIHTHTETPSVPK